MVSENWEDISCGNGGWDSNLAQDNSGRIFCQACIETERQEIEEEEVTDGKA